MLAHADYLLQLHQIDLDYVRDMGAYFNNLPQTGHADTAFRLRRYSVVSMRDGVVCDEQRQTFCQSSDVNGFQGDVLRQFEPLESTLISSKGMLQLCQGFQEANQLDDGHEIEIHQIRIITQGSPSLVAPEGIHQDGFAHIAIVGIARHNIQGGDFMVFRGKGEKAMFNEKLRDGEVAMLADDKLWHYAKPIKIIDTNDIGYMDVFVLTAKGSA
ncbi:agglutination protein [Alginatibacterium sediminis]|uniref:Agglutination protein n=1 Tax=Alginatibacterium sediminis TaxID=2164068 RepID=A0A420E9Z5_9ALTE|nr:2OG-Fe dioxygenase family protein [Alginatibacterium sediminis]RKF17503.1 agglutination protein [Alginatibacterium sediminis]